MNNTIKIRVGDFDVLDSGCITSVDGKDIEFTLTEKIVVKMVFKMTDDKEQRLDANIVENGNLVFTLQNFNNPLGTEATDAIEIGIYQGRKLYLHLRVIGMESNANRVLFYTWYLGNAINNG